MYVQYFSAHAFYFMGWKHPHMLISRRQGPPQSHFYFISGPISRHQSLFSSHFFAFHSIDCGLTRALGGALGRSFGQNGLASVPAWYRGWVLGVVLLSEIEIESGFGKELGWGVGKGLGWEVCQRQNWFCQKSIVAWSGNVQRRGRQGTRGQAGGMGKDGVTQIKEWRVRLK